jgi:hypothetical protein
MPLSPHMSRKLQEALGLEAGEELVTWMSNVDDLRGDVAELRHAMENRMDQGFARLETLIERRSADLIKWSFVFWVTAVGAIAALAGVMK